MADPRFAIEVEETWIAFGLQLLNRDVFGRVSIELGNVIGDPALQRTADSQITVADLTGVAVQDIQISKAVYGLLRSDPPGG